MDTAQAPELDISKQALHKEAERLRLPITQTLNWSDICSRNSLVKRAEALGHPDPISVNTEEIARLGTHITRLAMEHDHPNPGNATLADVRSLLGESRLAEVSPEKLKTFCNPR